MEKIKVLYISHESGLNGAPRSMFEMINGLNDFVEPLVILPKTGPLEVLLKDSNINTIIVPFENLYREIPDTVQNDENLIYRKNGQAALKIAKIVKEKKIDVIHTNSSVTDVGALAAAIAKVPHIWHIRELIEEHFQMEYSDIVTKKMLLETATYKIAVSDSVKKSFYEKYRMDLYPLFDGIDLKKYSYDGKKAVTKKSNILFAGVLSEAKGQFDAIRAIEILVNKNKWCGKLYIVGNGSYNFAWALKEYVRKKGLEKNVCILMFQNDLTNLRNSCDIALVCSRYEALGRVTMEAMASGLIVVGTNTGGTKEIIGTENLRGRLYSPGNYLGLSLEIENVLDLSEDMQDSYRNRAFEFIEEFADIKKYCKKILDIYIKAKKENVSNDQIKEIYRKVKKYKENTKNTEPMVVAPVSDKFKELFHITEKWLTLKQRGRSMVEYFSANGIKTVGIYGMNYLGCHLFDELVETEIEVLFGVDQNGFPVDDIIEVYTPAEEFPVADIIVVTAISNEDIKNLLKEKERKFIEIREIIDWMQKQ